MPDVLEFGHVVFVALFFSGAGCGMCIFFSPDSWKL